MAARKVALVQAKLFRNQIILLRPWLMTPAAEIQHRSLFWGGILTKSNFTLQNAIKRSMSPIVEEGIGTHKPSEFQKRTLVWAKMYASVDKVPERVTRNQIKVAMDKFRVRASIIMVIGTFLSAFLYAYIGKREREQGKSMTQIVLDRRQS